MFKCEKCGEIQRPGVKATKQVVETRRHIYPFRRGANVLHREGKVERRDDNGGTGDQIVREVTLCPSCAHPKVESPRRK